MAIMQEIVTAGKFLSESLKVYEKRIIDTVYPDYWGYEGMYHQAIRDLPFGALSYVTARMDYTGRAANYGGKATTLPLANFGINMDEYDCQVGVVAADWSWQELASEAASASNQFLPRINVVENYRRAMERSLREWMHIKAVFGDPSIDFTGLVNNPFVEVIEVAANANPFTGTVPDSTQAERSARTSAIYEWFRTELSAFRASSGLTAEATVSIVSEPVRSAMQRRFGDNSNDGTPELMLAGRNSTPSIRYLRTVNEFTGSTLREMSGITSIGGITLPAQFDLVMLLDAATEDEIVRHYADIQTLEPRLLDDGLTFRQVGLCATSEMIFMRPFRAKTYILRRS